MYDTHINEQISIGGQGVTVVCEGGACSLQSVFLSLLVIKPLARGSTLLFPFLLPSAHHKCLIYPPSIHLFTSLAESRLETVVVWTISKVICSFHASHLFFIKFSFFMGLLPLEHLHRTHVPRYYWGALLFGSEKKSI